MSERRQKPADTSQRRVLVALAPVALASLLSKLPQAKLDLQSVNGETGYVTFDVCREDGTKVIAVQLDTLEGTFHVMAELAL